MAKKLNTFEVNSLSLVTFLYLNLILQTGGYFVVQFWRFRVLEFIYIRGYENGMCLNVAYFVFFLLIWEQS